METDMATQSGERHVAIGAGNVTLESDLSVPENAAGLVVFAHGSSGSRQSAANQYMARSFNQQSFATLMVDLLSADEMRDDQEVAEYRYNVRLLANRLLGVTDWVKGSQDIKELPRGYFAAGADAAATFVADAERPGDVRAIVSRAGRPDLVELILPRVRAATLLIVGDDDPLLLDLTRDAYQLLRSEKEILVIGGATHRFERPDVLDPIIERTCNWLRRHMLSGEQKGAQPQAGQGTQPSQSGARNP
jgi:pimeloyl-ACP methyl ester carboxylesterase